MNKIFYLLCIIILSGCSLSKQSNHNDLTQMRDWSTHLQKIDQLSTWSLKGKLAIYIEDERQSANIYWQQEKDNYYIQLTSFIGTHLLSIKKNQQIVEIINNEGDKFTGKDTKTLIQNISPGLHLPISALQEWVKGNPVDATFQLNSEQNVNTLLGQDNNHQFWYITYQQYQVFSGISLPRKIELTRDNIRLKIMINQWILTKE